MTARHDRWLVPAAAVAAGTGGALAGLTLPHWHQIGASAVLAATMAAIALVDLDRLRVPDPLNLLAALAGLATVWLAARAEGAAELKALGSALLQAAVCGGALLFVREAFFRLRRVDGLGLGDVKLGATAGVWLGWQLFAVAVTAAAMSALVFVALHVALRGPWPGGRRIPFAAFLAPATWAAWYLSMLLDA
jgi:leader peptidase (prepilin peptidase)/N-methyltransferase